MEFAKEVREEKREYNRRYRANLSEEKKEERIQYSREYNDNNRENRLLYQKIEIDCPLCNCTYRKCKKSVHFASNKHILNKRIFDLEALILANE
jgi:hypothetical protein